MTIFEKYKDQIWLKMGVNISEMLEGAELFETSSIKIEESLKYSTDIHILLEEMKYGIG